MILWEEKETDVGREKPKDKSKERKKYSGIRKKKEKERGMREGREWQFSIKY